MSYNTHETLLTHCTQSCDPHAWHSIAATPCTCGVRLTKILIELGPEFQVLFLIELVTLLFEALFSFLIPDTQHTLRL